MIAFGLDPLMNCTEISRSDVPCVPITGWLEWNCPWPSAKHMRHVGGLRISNELLLPSKPWRYCQSTCCKLFCW
jgi:hypothetical protein